MNGQRSDVEVISATSNLLLEKSFAFALRVMKLRKYLLYDAPYKEHDVSRQLLCSATSIGANAEEAQGAQSPTDFIAKVSISYKEARESRYWIRLLGGAGYIDENMSASLLADIEELCRILSSILITSKKRLQKGVYTR